MGHRGYAPAMAFQSVMLVATGGAIGAVARYAVDVGVHGAFGGRLRDLGAGGLPVGTLAANVIGCLLIGFLMHLFLERGAFDERARLLLVTGVLGSLTTFSAFGFETFQLIERGRWATAGGYVCVAFVAGLAAVGFGWWCSSLFGGGGRA